MTSSSQENREALLEAEVASLKGKLAAQRRASPTPTNGVVRNPPAPGRIKSMQDAFKVTCAELGWRPRD